MKKIKFLLLTGAFIAPAGALTIVSCSDNKKEDSIKKATESILVFVSDELKPEFSNDKKEDTKYIKDVSESLLNTIKVAMESFNQNKTLENYKELVKSVNNIKASLLKDDIKDIKDIQIIPEQYKIVYSSGEYKLNIILQKEGTTTETTVSEELKSIITNFDEISKLDDSNELKPKYNSNNNSFEMVAYFPYNFNIFNLERKLFTYEEFQIKWSSNVIEGINFAKNDDNLLLDIELNQENDLVKISYNNSASLLISLKTHPKKLILSQLFENEQLIINKQDSKKILETNARLKSNLTDDDWTNLGNSQNLEEVVNILKIEEGNIINPLAINLIKNDLIDWTVDKENYWIEFHTVKDKNFKIKYILEKKDQKSFKDLVDEFNNKITAKTTISKTNQELSALSLSLTTVKNSISLLNTLNTELNLEINIDNYFLQDTLLDSSKNDIFIEDAKTGKWEIKEILFSGTEYQINTFKINYYGVDTDFVKVESVDKLKEEIDSADGINTKKILLKAGLYELDSALIINKDNIQIFGESQDPETGTRITNNKDMNQLISIQASNVKIANTRIVHKIINTATSVETSVSIAKGVSGTTVINNTIYVPEFAIAGIMMSNTQIINNKFYYDSNISGTSRVIGIYGASKINYIRGNSLDLQDNTSARVIFIYSSSNNPGTGEPSPHFEGQLIVRRNDITTNRTVTGFYSQDVFIKQDLKTYSLRFEENKVRETSYFVSLYLNSNNQLDLFSTIEVNRNDISNKHNDRGQSKGVLSLDGLGTNLTPNSNPIRVSVTGNILENTEAKRDDYDIAEDWIGYKVSVFNENKIIKK